MIGKMVAIVDGEILYGESVQSTYGVELDGRLRFQLEGVLSMDTCEGRPNLHRRILEIVTLCVLQDLEEMKRAESQEAHIYAKKAARGWLRHRGASTHEGQE